AEAFYRTASGCECFGVLKQYANVNGAPALALRLDLDVLRTYISELRDGNPVDSDVYTFLFSPGAVEPAMARLEADMAKGFPRVEDVRDFFSRYETGNKMSPTERAYVDQCW